MPIPEIFPQEEEDPRALLLLRALERPSLLLVVELQVRGAKITDIVSVSAPDMNILTYRAEESWQGMTAAMPWFKEET